MSSHRATRRREAARISTYFLDESGNTGDVTKTGPRFAFDNQPLFVLACVGVEDVDGLARAMASARAAHGVGGAEVKASALSAKPRFVAELLGYLRQHDLPLFMEVVDKRFFICTQIVERLLLPAVGLDFDLSPHSLFIKNTFAEHLATTAPDHVLLTYVAACHAPSVESVGAAYLALRLWLEERVGDEVAEGMLRFLRDEEQEFEGADHSDPEVLTKPLPLPDDSLRGRPVWLLPNLTSFTNIYGRLNKFHGRKVGRLTLIHDEQLHFEHIIRGGKVSAEALSARGESFVLPHADFRFRESAKLRFARSTETPGVQLADVIAGFTMRYLRDALAAAEPHQDQYRAFWELMRAGATRDGAGINYVLTHRDLRRLGIPTI